MTTRANSLPMITTALASTCFPLAMEQSGGPPVPIRKANAMTTVMIGKETPTPVSAEESAPGIRPMYIRSTIL